MRDPDDLFAALGRSAFRSRFKLRGREMQYLRDKGLAVVLRHAGDFIARRLAPVHPPNDGKQTPFRNHPVFVAQHATATCCRSCLAKWHGIPRGRVLTPCKAEHVLGVIRRYSESQTMKSESPSLNGARHVTGPERPRSECRQ